MARITDGIDQPLPDLPQPGSAVETAAAQLVADQAPSALETAIRAVLGEL